MIHEPYGTAFAAVRRYDFVPYIVTASRRRCAAFIAALLLAPRAAFAHPGASLAPHDVWSAWNFAPAVLGGCAVALVAYLRGLRALWARAGAGRVVSARRAACYALGWLTLLVALVSPLDPMGAVLFSAHMVQHLLLMMAAAPLFVLGDPLTASLWVFPIGVRRGVGAWWLRRRSLRALWRGVSTPGVAWTLHVVTLWVWHAPSLYDRALADERVHVVEHLAFFATALLFWWALFAPHGRRLGSGAGVVYLFAAALQGTILGAVLTLARHPLYTAHFGTTRAWGLTPLEDQQLAGLLMWVPAGAIYLAALIPLALRILREPRDQGVRTLAMVGVSARGTS
jgi:putative membrane protein